MGDNVLKLVKWAETFLAPWQLLLNRIKLFIYFIYFKKRTWKLMWVTVSRHISFLISWVFVLRLSLQAAETHFVIAQVQTSACTCVYLGSQAPDSLLPLCRTLACPAGSTLVGLGVGWLFGGCLPVPIPTWAESTKPQQQQQTQSCHLHSLDEFSGESAEMSEVKPKRSRE